MDLNLRTLGRPAARLTAVQVRELNELDLALLDAPRASAAVPTIKRLRDSHHALAKALASGMTNAEASAVTGFSLSRISILLQDPTFQELLAGYRNAASAEFVDEHTRQQQRMVNLNLDAMGLLLDRMEEAPQDFEPRDVLNIVKVTADRTGHAPVTRSVQTTLRVDIGARLANARERSGLAPVLELEVQSEEMRVLTK